MFSEGKIKWGLYLGTRQHILNIFITADKKMTLQLNFEELIYRSVCVVCVCERARTHKRGKEEIFIKPSTGHRLGT